MQDTLTIRGEMQVIALNANFCPDPADIFFKNA